MDDIELKKKIMDEIMGLMDEKEGEQLKSHPKLMAAKVEVEEPLPEELEVKSEETSLEAPKEESEEIDPEMMAKLMEMYKGMK